jgi:hypothetical protein
MTYGIAPARTVFTNSAVLRQRSSITSAHLGRGTSPMKSLSSRVELRRRGARSRARRVPHHHRHPRIDREQLAIALVDVATLAEQLDALAQLTRDLHLAAFLPERRVVTLVVVVVEVTKSRMRSISYCASEL